jgi:uncharacterized glyoxalase superfamily protein PhnB
MNPSPNGWPRLAPSLFYGEPAKAIDFLRAAFGFEVRIRIDGPPGVIIHSELTYGGAVVMVSTDSTVPGAHHPGEPHRSPRGLGGGITQSLFLYTDDIEAHCVRARAAGAKIVSEPATVDYGEGHWVDRGYEAEDPEGHRWYFAQRLSG